MDAELTMYCRCQHTSGLVCHSAVDYDRILTIIRWKDIHYILHLAILLNNMSVSGTKLNSTIIRLTSIYIMGATIHVYIIIIIIIMIENDSYITCLTCKPCIYTLSLFLNCKVLLNLHVAINYPV